MKSDCAAGQQGRTLDQDAEAFSPSFQVLSRCPRRRTFRAGFLWWVGEKRKSRVSAAHLSWSRFQIKAGAVGGARDHALGPAGGAAPRGKPFGKPGPTLRARNCPGGSGVVCRGGGVGKREGRPVRRDSQADTGSAFCPLHVEFREEGMAQRKRDSLRTVIGKERDASASRVCAPDASVSDLPPTPRIESMGSHHTLRLL